MLTTFWKIFILFSQFKDPQTTSFLTNLSSSVASSRTDLWKSVYSSSSWLVENSSNSFWLNFRPSFSIRAVMLSKSAFNLFCKVEKMWTPWLPRHSEGAFSKNTNTFNIKLSHRSATDLHLVPIFHHFQVDCIFCKLEKPTIIASFVNIFSGSVSLPQSHCLWHTL